MNHTLFLTVLVMEKLLNCKNRTYHMYASDTYVYAAIIIIIIIICKISIAPTLGDMLIYYLLSIFAK